MSAAAELREQGNQLFEDGKQGHSKGSRVRISSLEVVFLAIQKCLLWSRFSKKLMLRCGKNQAIGLRTMKLTKMFFFKHPSRKRTIGFQLLPGRVLAISLLKDAYTIPHISVLTYCMYMCTLCTYFYRWRVCITTIFLCITVLCTNSSEISF